MPENGTLGLTWRELETELRDGLRHRQMAKAAGKPLLPVPTATAPALDPTRHGRGLETVSVSRRYATKNLVNKHCSHVEQLRLVKTTSIHIRQAHSTKCLILKKPLNWVNNSTFIIRQRKALG